MNSYDYHRQAKIDKAIDKTAGIYPGGNGEDYLHSGLPGVGYIASRWARTVSTVFVCTRAEFEARKAERQGKPSWDDAPAKSSWLAQDLSGAWFFFDEKPGVIPGIWIGGNAVKQSTGEVIGDWHNTLEQRPNAVGRPPLQVNLIPAVDGESPIDTANRMIHALLQRPNHIGESGEKVSTRAEIEQAAQACERALNEFFPEAKLGSADWYDYDKQEATKLPPVGAACECFNYESNEFVKVKVLDAVTGSRECAVATINGDSFGWVFWGCKFRPLDWNRNLQPNPDPEPSPELSFHLSNAFNELQAGARLLPDSDPRKTQLAALAGAVSAIREVA